MDRAFHDQPLDLPIEQRGIVLRRTGHDVLTNVPHLVVHHSPTGYEWGYGGSGPADLALNILDRNRCAPSGRSGMRLSLHSIQPFCLRVRPKIPSIFQQPWLL